MSAKSLGKVSNKCIQGAGWKKLVQPKVAPGRTAWPTNPTDQVAVGVRTDYAGQVTVPETVVRQDEATGQEVVVVEDVVYNEFKVQPNAGKIDSFFKKWRDAHGGTHAVMATMRVKNNGTQDDVEKAWDEVIEEVKGSE